MFFFEKKNQKTFAPGAGVWLRRLGLTPALSSKSFFGSFFQKRTSFLMPGLLARLLGRAPPAPDVDLVLKPIAGRCAFIIGPARSGTTVLLNALNASRDCYLLGEPDFHTDPGGADFAARYHAMHAQRGNLECKSTALPGLLPADGPWWAWLARLAEHHHRVGAKIAVSPGDDPMLAGLLAFQTRYFYPAAHIFCFRNPLDSAMSLHVMSGQAARSDADWDALFLNILSVIGLYVRMVQMFPAVHAVMHESVGTESFAGLGAALGCDLSAAPGYYADSRVSHYTIGDIPQAAQQRCQDLMTIYELLGEIVADGPRLVQSEQNAFNIHPGHRTKLGRLAILLHPVFGGSVGNLA